MTSKQLYIFIEGDDDERFFQTIIIPKLEARYDFLKLVKHRQEKKEYIDRFIRSIKAMDADYIFTRDINGAPCITDRKQRVQNEFKSIDEDKIVIVIREIESWYLAGMDNSVSKKCGIKFFNNTDNVTKKQFDDLIPNKFDSRIDFMQEVLKFFCIETAKMRNKSFDYFLRKYDLKF